MNLGQKGTSQYNAAVELSWDVPVGQDYVSEGFSLALEYTVTDPSVSAGENVEGWVENFHCEVTVKDEYGGGTIRLFEVRTDEFTNFLRSNAKDDAISIYDAQPTTATLQRAGFFWEQHVDWSMFNSGYMKLYLRAATAEWGTATAMSMVCSVELEDGDAGAVPFSIARVRKASASGTTHELKMPEPGILSGADIIFGTGNTYKNLKVKATADQDAYVQERSDMFVHQWLRSYAEYDSVPGSNSLDRIKLPPMTVPKDDARKIDLETSSASTILCWSLNVIG